MAKTYVETFSDGPGGWIAWGFTDAERVVIQNGVAISRGPWWVDYNHAPPGGGYLHLLYCLHTTTGPLTESLLALSGANRFVAGGYPTDFADAEITVRIRGNVDLKGAQVVLLVQADLPGRRVNLALTGQPVAVGHEWHEQTLRLMPDESEWTQLGSRWDRTTLHVGNPNVAYGEGPIDEVLRDVNCDIIFILFPLDVGAAGGLDGDLHRLRPGDDYPVDFGRLPSGHVELDEVRIKFRG